MDFIHITALGRIAFGHNKHLKSVAAAILKHQPTSILSSLPFFTIKGTTGGYTTPSHYAPSGPISRAGGDSQLVVCDGRISTSNPLATSGVLHGSPISDESSQHSDTGILNNCISNGVTDHARSRPLDTALLSQCVSAMCTLAKDPSPRIAGLGWRVLSIIGIEQVVTRFTKSTGHNVRPSESNSLAGISRSSSLLNMNAGKFSSWSWLCAA